MRNETLLKIIIAAFAIILIILATFVYGNIQRSKQKTKTTSNQNTVQSPQSSTQQNTDNKNTEQNNSTSNPSSTTQPTQNQQSNSVSPSTTAPSSTQQNSSIPSTGANDAVIPMTIVSTLGYVYIKNRKARYTK